jgi:ABC-type oligopeptide transport system substrate-binding subunit
MVRIVVRTGGEELLMRSMPIIPLYCDSSYYLERPLVLGLEMNPGNMPLLKYAWIDTNWGAS